MLFEDSLFCAEILRQLILCLNLTLNNTESVSYAMLKPGFVCTLFSERGARYIKSVSICAQSAQEERVQGSEIHPVYISGMYHAMQIMNMGGDWCAKVRLTCLKAKSRLLGLGLAQYFPRPTE